MIKYQIIRNSLGEYQAQKFSEYLGGWSAISEWHMNEVLAENAIDRDQDNPTHEVAYHITFERA